jgi:hypothetical protein
MMQAAGLTVPAPVQFVEADPAALQLQPPSAFPSEAQPGPPPPSEPPTLAEPVDSTEPPPSLDPSPHGPSDPEHSA